MSKNPNEIVYEGKVYTRSDGEFEYADIELTDGESFTDIMIPYEGKKIRIKIEILE